MVKEVGIESFFYMDFGIREGEKVYELNIFMLWENDWLIKNGYIEVQLGVGWVIILFLILIF